MRNANLLLTVIVTATALLSASAIISYSGMQRAFALQVVQTMVNPTPSAGVTVHKSPLTLVGGSKVIAK